jgi:hypothetical protein
MESLVCEHEQCSSPVSIEGEAHSCLIVLQKVDKDGYSYYQCDSGQEANFMTFQHWHCCQRHMQSNLIHCIQDHYQEYLLHKPEMGTTILHRKVLGSMLECKICGVRLRTEAYRFCLTVATPINSLIDSSHSDELAEWCCSLDHAKEVASEYISRL